MKQPKKVNKYGDPIFHETTTMEYIKREMVEVDNGLVNLIQVLWDLDLHTENCCEDNVPEDWAWICFETPWDGLTFLQYILEDPDNFDMFDMDEDDLWDEKTGYNKAKFDINGINMNLHKIQGSIALSVRFPNVYIERFVGILRGELCRRRKWKEAGVVKEQVEQIKPVMKALLDAAVENGRIGERKIGKRKKR